MEASTYDFVTSLPDWYQTQISLQAIVDALNIDMKENNLTEEERDKLKKKFRDHYWILNVEPYNVLPI